MTSDLNERIALAKGWTWSQETIAMLGLAIPLWPIPRTHWRDSEGHPAIRPDYVGTLEGITGLLRELYEATDKVLEVLLILFNDGVQCALDTVSSGERHFWAPWERWGDCVGEAWLSVFGKELANAL